MTFLHSADWHLGRLLHDQSLVEEQSHFLLWFTRLCAKEKPDALLLAGDIFDRSIPSEEAVNLWTRFLEDLRSQCPTLPLVVIAGNHDNPSRLEFASGILRAASIHVTGRWTSLVREGDCPQPVEVTSASGEKAQIWPLPFLWPGALEVQEEDVSRPTGTQEESLQEGLRRFTPLQDPQCLQVLVGHCFARGGRVSESERTLVGTATQVDAGVFSQFHYTALGHLHRPQEVCPGVWYSGSPLAYSFSESPDKKVVLKVEVTRDAPPVILPIPVPVSRLVTVLRGALGDILSDPQYLVHKDSYLRVETTGTGGIAHPFHRLRQVFPWILSYEEIQTGDLGPALGDPGKNLPLGDRQRDIKEDFGDFMDALGIPTENKLDFSATFQGLTDELHRQGGTGE